MLIWFSFVTKNSDDFVKIKIFIKIIYLYKKPLAQNSDEIWRTVFDLAYDFSILPDFNNSQQIKSVFRFTEKKKKKLRDKKKLLYKQMYSFWKT